MGIHRAEGRRRIATLIALFAVLCSVFGVVNASAASISSGTVGDFEDDGNLVEAPATPGSIDWNSVDTASADFTKVTDDVGDSGYSGTSKENDPEGFVCNSGGSNPGKNNILR